MFTNIIVKSIIVATGAVLSISTNLTPVNALIRNPGFEDNFNGWVTTNTTEDEKNRILVVPSTDLGNSPAQGNAAVMISKGTSPNSLQSFLGLADNLLQDNQVRGGSAIKQTFTVNAGDILSFDWNFLSNDLTENDFAFVKIGDTVKLLSSALESNLKPISFNLPSSFGNEETFPFQQETTWDKFSHIFNATGETNLAFGVFNVGNNGEPRLSGLLLDNMTIASVPEPASLLSLLIFATFTAGLYQLERKKQ
jgi:hypothetical protein